MCLGERFTRVNHRGLSLYNWAEEGGLGAGEATPAGPRNPYPNGPSMTYFPVPFLLSSRGYGLRLHGSDRSEFHLGSERPDALRVAISSATLELTIWLYDDPLATVIEATALPQAGSEKKPPPAELLVSVTTVAPPTGETLPKVSWV